MKITDNLEKLCYPIDVQVDIKKLRNSIEEFFSRIGITEEFFTNELTGLILPKRAIVTCNLSHLPELTGNDRWLKHRSDHNTVLSEGVKEEDFSEFLEELNGLYIKDVIDQVLQNHFENFKTRFQGRCQFIWSRPTHCYRLHRDPHTKHRYHIPVYTDENFLWIFEKEDRDMNLIHMPANGNVWYLNPRNVKHTVSHMGSVNRLHILLTSGH
jgi:hypothetical protein